MSHNRLRLASYALLASLSVLASGISAGRAPSEATPAWSRHCTVPAVEIRDDAERAALATAAKRCEPRDACVLACRRSLCEQGDGSPGGCPAACDRALPEDWTRRADRYAERSCSLFKIPSGTFVDETVADGEWERNYVDVADAAGLGELKDTPLADGAVEVRIWASGGAFIRQPMLRLRRSARGTVDGDLYIHYRADYATDADAPGREFRRFLRAGCHDSAIGAYMGVCRAKFTHPPRWEALYRRFVALGLLTLPDQDDLPEPARAEGDPTPCVGEVCALEQIVISDGSGMRVQVRQGADYRAYRYSNPCWTDCGPEQAAAAQIVERVLSMHWRFDEK